jgi:hypothetical protein
MISLYHMSVLVGGIEDNKGKRIINGSFKIVQHGFGYKIVFCPRITAPPVFVLILEGLMMRMEGVSSSLYLVLLKLPLRLQTILEFEDL